MWNSGNKECGGYVGFEKGILLKDITATPSSLEIKYSQSDNSFTKEFKYEFSLLNSGESFNLYFLIENLNKSDLLNLISNDLRGKGVTGKSNLVPNKVGFYLPYGGLTLFIISLIYSPVVSFFIKKYK